MSIYGTETAGFSIDIESSSRQLSVRAWGFWSLDLCSIFDEKMQRAVSGFDGATSFLLYDLLEFLPQSTEVFERQKGMMERMQKQGMNRVVAIINNAITVLQMKRLASHLKEMTWTICSNEREAQKAIKGF